MVLQRDTNVPIFGTATPGSKITVIFSNQKRDTTANKNGEWRVDLKSLKASDKPQDLLISSAGHTIAVKNVLVGDVWLCAGQDNMQWSVKNSTDAANEIAAANYPTLRFFNVSNTPDARLFLVREKIKGDWKDCSPQTVPFFSAVAYFFGRELTHSIKVPIGLVETSWGGSNCAAWLPRQTLEDRQELTSARELLLQALNAPVNKQDIAEQEKRWRAFTDLHATDEGDKAIAAHAYDDKAWPSTPLPVIFTQLKEVGSAFDGEVWFRRSVKLPKNFIGKALTLSLGAIDDNDTVWFNGEKVGQTGLKVPNFWSVDRKYTIPAALTKSGECTLAIRVFNQYGTGGFTSSADQLYLQCDKERMPISDNWRYHPGKKYPQNSRKTQATTITPTSAVAPTALYNTRIFPLIPLAIKGVIWYQGEADIANAHVYRLQFQELIRSWRRNWNTDIPFLFVQLANFSDQGPRCERWPELREAQEQCLEQSRTGMAVTIDIGRPDTLQPPAKQEVGRRLALAAQRVAYGQNIIASGPVFSGKDIKKGRVILHFEQIGDGLVARKGTLTGFTIAGEDRVFHPAQAKIEGNQIAVTAPIVPAPAAVRYAWSDNPQCNLYNKENLPAPPFRTDNWPLPNQ